VLVAICVGLFFALAVLVLPGRWTVENDVLLGAKRARFALAQATHASVSRDPDGHAFLRINGRGDEVRIPVTWLPIRIEDFLLDIGLGRTHPWEDWRTISE
jgi:hypothetical protein